MVPVPEEHVAAIQAYVRWSGLGGRSSDWTTADVIDFADRLDDRARELLVLVAERCVAVEPLSVGEAAGILGCASREVLGTVFELNAAVSAAGGPFLGLAPDTGPADRDAWTLNMPDALARLVATAIGGGVDDTRIDS
jgi:hypothetical protein